MSIFERNQCKTLFNNGIVMITKEEAQKELAFRELARRKLDFFVQQVDPFYWHEGKGYVFKPFHKIITNALEDVIAWRKKKIMISVPPQHGKSTISTQRFPLFAHLKDPTQYIVSASYSWDLAKTHLSKARQIVEWPQFKALWMPLNFTTNGAFEYTLAEWWWYYAVWVGGSLTGRPIDIGIIDDVHKDRLEYESDTIRNNTWDWYTSVFLSRLHKDSAQIGVMTRWWEDDLFWRILELEWDEWEIINIPVLDWTNTIFPERFPYDFIQKKRAVMWERDFQALYMWDPINEWWWDFKKEYFRYEEMGNIEQIIKRMKIVSFLDPAISQKQEWDFSAIVTVWHDLQSNLRYVLEVKQLKASPNEIIDEVFDTARYWKNKWQSYKMGIEVVQYQKMLALAIRDEMRKRDFHFTMEEVTPRGEKEARIRSILQPLYSNSSIIHIRGKNINELEVELLKFPNWKHDDIIDALSSACSIMQSSNLSSTYRTTVRNANNLI